MSKRKYTHVKELLPTIEAMKEEGMTFREIANRCGLEDRMVVKELLRRQRRKAQQQPKRKGYKPARTLQEYKNENKRLKMEVELMRDFLQSIEGM